MKKLCKFTAITVAMMIFIFTMSLQTFAASRNDFYDGQLSITDTGNTGTGTATKYTITIKGGRFSTSTNKITIKNESTENDAQVSFSYLASNYDSFTLAGNSVSASGEYQEILTAGSSVEIKLTAGKDVWSPPTATLILSNINYAVIMAESSEVKIEFDEALGSVTAGGTAISSGSSVAVEGDGVAMVATPASGVKFIGWVDEKDKIISKDKSYTQTSVGNITVRALFSKGTPYFMADNTYLSFDLNTIATKGATLVLVCEGILPAGDYVIPAGKTLLIPFDAANTLYTSDPKNGVEVDTYTAPSAYRTLTMANGASININGAISLSAMQSASQGSTGAVTGKYGHIEMQEGSAITVNNGGCLYVWGYISGKGEVTAKSGATVYENFQVSDWRGGDATTSMLNNTQRVFPMSQYYVQNIQVPLTLEAGAAEYGYMSVYVTLAGVQHSPVPFIGPDGMFRIESGSITKDYDETTDRLVISVNNGVLNMASLTISMKISLIGSPTVNSQNYTLPINGNITLHINEGSQINVSQDMALLPGGEINVYKGAKCTFTSGAKAFIYDLDEWGNYCAHTNQNVMPVRYAHGQHYTRTADNLKDAVVYIEGEVDAEAGFVYTTAGGANIHGAEGALAKIKTDVDTTRTYQATQIDREISYNSISVTSANLKNTDGTYTDPEVLGDCCSTYVVSDGKWTPENPSHTEVLVPAVEPTCTEAGKTEGSYCSACNTVIKQQETVPALGHSYGDWTIVDDTNHSKICACGDTITATHGWDAGVITISATHTATGVKTYTCAECKATKTEEIEKLAGHTYGEWAKVDDSNHSKSCVCGDVITEGHNWDAGVVTTPANCKESGVKTFTCSECNGTKTEVTPIVIDGHTFVGLKCSVCGCEKIVTSTTYMINDESLVINTSLISEVSSDSIVIIVTYAEGGRVRDVSMTLADTLEEVTLSAADVKMIKVFVLDGVDKLTPISVVEKLEI